MRKAMVPIMTVIPANAAVRPRGTIQAEGRTILLAKRASRGVHVHSLKKLNIIQFVTPHAAPQTPTAANFKAPFSTLRNCSDLSMLTCWLTRTSDCETECNGN